MVICKDRTWNVHKLVVCTQSDFFSKACDGSFVVWMPSDVLMSEYKLTLRQEAQENKITLSDDDSDVIDVMLRYLYHFDYSDEIEGGIPPLLLNLHLFAIADKYFIEPLQKLATEKFNRRAYEHWASDAFAETLETLFESSFAEGSLETLRLIVLEVVKEHAKELFNNDAYGRFQMATVSAPAFLFEYVKSITTEPSTKSTVARTSNLVWYKCPGMQCQKHAAVFGIRNTVPNNFKFNCPLRCTVDQT